MAVERIPLNAVPSQVLSVQLGAQSCRIGVRQRRTGLFVDLYVQDTPVALGMKALDRKFMVRAAYTGFIGDLFFVDTQGEADPQYDGLGSRWQLAWDSEAP